MIFVPFLERAVEDRGKCEAWDQAAGAATASPMTNDKASDKLSQRAAMRWTPEMMRMRQ